MKMYPQSMEYKVWRTLVLFVGEECKIVKFNPTSYFLAIWFMNTVLVRKVGE